MGPLGFVNWRSVNAYFCLLMWLVAVILAVIVLGHVIHTPPPGHGGQAVGVR